MYMLPFRTESRREYSVLRSPTRRFKDAIDKSPFGVYDIETAHRKGLTASCRGTEACLLVLPILVSLYRTYFHSYACFGHI